MTLQQKFDNLISTNKLGEAIELLRLSDATKDKELKNTLVLLSSQYYSNEDENKKLMLEPSSYKREKARIINALQQTMNELPEEILNSKILEKNDKSNNIISGNDNFVLHNISNFTGDINVNTKPKIETENNVSNHVKETNLKLSDKEITDKLFNFDNEDFEEFCRTNFKDFYKRKYSSLWTPLAKVNAIMDYFMRNHEEKVKCVEILTKN